MKKILLVLFFAFVQCNAYALPLSYSNCYADGFLGVSFSHKTKSTDKQDYIASNSGFVIGGKSGYRFFPYFRTEAEIAFRQNEYTEMVVAKRFHLPANGDIKKTTLIGNAICDIPLFEGCVTPYFGAGAGKYWDNIKFGLNPIKTDEGTLVFKTMRFSETGFAYQGIVGVTVQLDRKLHTALEYRYLDGRRTEGNHTLALNMKLFF